MLRIRQSASKDGAVTGPERERFARIAKPFSAEGEAIALPFVAEPWVRKREAIQIS